MRIVIIEDEKIAANELAETLVCLDPDIQIVAFLTSIKESIAYFNKNLPPDLIFSDIQLGDGLSFEIFKTIAISIPIIFCTAYDEYTLNAFKTNGIDYILKPYTSKTVGTSIQKYYNLRKTFIAKENQYDTLIETLNKSTSQSQKSIIINYKDKIIPVRINDIALFYVEDKLTHLLTFNSISYVVEKSLEDLELITGKAFFRANRQILINRKTVISASRYFSRKLSINITVPFNDVITISKEKTPLFLEWLKHDTQ